MEPEAAVSAAMMRMARIHSGMDWFRSVGIDVAAV
jgi:hypothetical protein